MAENRVVLGPNYRTPLSKNVYLGSTVGLTFESYTCAPALVPDETVDGFTMKVLQPGTLMAKATSGANSGKVGVFSAAATDGRQTAANIVGVADTFVPWQLNERDVDIAVLTHGVVNPTRCYGYDDGGTKMNLIDLDADAGTTFATSDLRGNYKDITYRLASTAL